MTPAAQPWLETGYARFAALGPSALRVEPLARAVGKNKSSFYHLFGDLERYTELLLQAHAERYARVVEEEAASGSAAELVEVILEYREDILFSRQLLLHPEDLRFAGCFGSTSERAIPLVMPLWGKILGLPGHLHLAELVLRLSIENFFLQLTEGNLNRTWLLAYFATLRGTVQQLCAGVATSKGSS